MSMSDPIADMFTRVRNASMRQHEAVSVPHTAVITALNRVSKPGRRVYVGKSEIPWVLSGMGIAVLTTSKGVMTGQEARRQGVGGEVICEVW